MRDESAPGRRLDVATILRLGIEVSLLVGLLLFARLVNCPDCTRDVPYHRLDSPAGLRRWRKLMIHELDGVPCERCGLNRGITLLNWVLNKDYPCCAGKVFGTPTAASDFEDILTAFHRAPAVQVRVRYDYTDSASPDRNYRGSALLRWTKDNRQFIEAERTDRSGTTRFQVASWDSLGLHGRRNGSYDHLRTSLDVSLILTESFPRLGAAYGLSILESAVFDVVPGLPSVTVEKVFAPSDFAYDSNPGPQPSMTFRLNRKGSTVTLAYALHPLRLVRRTEVVPAPGGARQTLVEEYDEFSFPSAVLDADFQLPPDRK